MLSSLQLKQTTVNATRIDLSRGASTIIDHVIVQKYMTCHKVGSISVDLADHELTYLILDSEPPNCTTYRWLRNMRSFDPIAFQRDAETAEYRQFWEAIESSDIDRAVANWTEVFSAVVDKHAPLKLTKLKKHHQPWVTADIANWRQEAANLHYRAKKAAASGSQDAAALKREWRDCQIVVDAMERECKANHYASRIQEAGRNGSGELWKIVRGCMPRKRSQGISNACKETANNFNKFFASVGQETADEVAGGEPLDLVSLLQDIPQSCAELTLHPVSEVDVLKVIGKFSAQKAPGLDGISVRFLKAAQDASCRHLKAIANLSFKLGRFPTPWKLAAVTPIYKGAGDPDSPGNNRPISLLPVPSKVVERLAYDQLYEYFLPFLSKHQNGFRRGHGTDTALLEVSEDLRKALDNQLAGLLVLLDMSKAFDCIQHPILLAKLERYGVTGVALDWFKSYLSDRSQKVCLRSGASTILSESCPVPCGVPQGSILGPLLFLVAVNDLPSVFKVLHVTQFADDTQLHVTCENVHLPAILREVQMELGAIAQWMRLNRLKLNATKSVCLRLGKWNTQATNPLVLNNHPIPNASSAKNL
ncbi:MAG: reverse transcriptase family protein, partial [Gammaproteobacteria bacterium]|nr:reverse transcriptase family protein [Gammaproteobacteria bacterium]